MSGAVIFCGPSLQDGDRDRWPEFRFHPPARQGDLYAAARAGAAAIGLIDGYFDGVPAVWHKEVLWALSRGVAVFGAASMGALRAAELCSFGMRGVGRIFEDYRDGRLCDDDEVALLHGPAETGYLPLSEPMVNIRATVERGLADGVLDAEAAEILLAVAKSQFYQERTWGSTLAAARDLPAPMRTAFRAWLPAGRQDRKRADALALLRAVADHVAAGIGPPLRPAPDPRPASFSFEWTEAWANAPWLGEPGQEGSGRDAGHERMILDELRLAGDLYLQLRRDALFQALVNRAVAQDRAEPQRDEIAGAALAFRLPLGLLRQRDVESWAAENGIDMARYQRLMAERAAAERLARSRDAELGPQILDQLRQRDGYAALRARAQAKAEMLRAGAGGAVPPRPLLLAWYFETRLGRRIPDDLVQYAADLGFSGLEDFHRALTAEYATHDGAPGRDGAAPGPHGETLAGGPGLRIVPPP